MNKQEMLLEIRRIAEEVYQIYKDRGLISMYLWGSFISPDFNIDTSDIDSVGFSDDTLPLDLEEEIRNELHKRFPHVEKFGFRIVYMSEMAGGVAKSQVSKWIPPRVFRHDFPSWVHMAGQKLEESDFGMAMPTNSEMISAHTKSIVEQFDFETMNEERAYQFVKAMARLLDFVQNKRQPQEAFSYSGLLRNAETESEKELADAIIESKKSNYHFAVFERNRDIFRKFWDAVRGSTSVT